MIVLKKKGDSAELSNSDPSVPKVVNINKIQKLEPSLNDF